jgi:chromosome segregation ATPase
MRVGETRSNFSLKKQDADELRRLTRKISELEQAILELKENPKKLKDQIDRMDTLLTQLNRHVNPTRDEVALLKRTNRELAKELVTVHDLLKKENE